MFETVAQTPRLINVVRDAEHLHAIISRVVREEDEVFAPVRKALTENEFSLVSSELRDDETLWFGKGWYVTVKLKGPRVTPVPIDLYKELSMN